MELSSPVHSYGICVGPLGACLTDDERREHPVTRWGRRSKITFLAALLAELFLPSPAVHDDLRIFGPSREPSSADLSAAMAAQDLHTRPRCGAASMRGLPLSRATLPAAGSPVRLTFASS